MSEFKINELPEKSNDQPGGQKNYRTPLRNLSQEQLIRIFDAINEDDRATVIPVGFPQAGKSLFLSSLMFYCETYTDKLWAPDYMLEYPFDNGELSRNQMIGYFNAGRAYPATTSGTVDIIGVDITPQNHRLPVLKIAFVDLAGEDLEKIKTSNAGEFDDKIEGVLRGCETGKPIFCLVTPYEPVKGDREEDQLHSDFMNYVKVKLPDLYEVAKFIVIVTQWDKVPSNKKLDVETYIEKKRPKLHTLINGRNSKVIYGEYSVGKVDNTKDEHQNNVVMLRRINFEHPHNFWNNLYKVTTGRSFDSGVRSFFKKLFG